MRLLLAALSIPAFCFSLGAAEGEAKARNPEKIVVKYYAGKGEVLQVVSEEGVRKVLEWVKAAEAKKESEHARNGACDRDAEILIYDKKEDAKPGKVVELFISCGHVQKKEAAGPDFDNLRKLAREFSEKK